MERELEKQLVKKYPKLFTEYGGSPQKTCMSWGCECGDGWYNILDELCMKLSNTKFHLPIRRYKLVPRNLLCKWLSKMFSWKIFFKKVYYRHEHEGVVFAQIKEKFGTLRIYLNGVPEEIYREVQDLINEAEYKSAKVCELCGEPAKLKTSGWHITICEKCENNVRISKNDL